MNSKCISPETISGRILEIISASKTGIDAMGVGEFLIEKVSEFEGNLPEPITTFIAELVKFGKIPGYSLFLYPGNDYVIGFKKDTDPIVKYTTFEERQALANLVFFGGVVFNPFEKDGHDYYEVVLFGAQPKTMTAEIKSLLSDCMIIGKFPEYEGFKTAINK